MNIKLFNSVPYSNKEEFIAGLTELGRLLGLYLDVDTVNNKMLMYHPAGIAYAGISFEFPSTTSVKAFLYNSNYYSNSLDISNNIPYCYIYYAISDDGKTVALGFNNSATTPKLSIFITSATNLTNPNEEIIVFGAQPLGSTGPFNRGVIVSKDFYEIGSYNQLILNKDNLVVLSPITTLFQNSCYKLHNIYTIITFKSTTATQEFLLNDKYYVSSACYEGGSSALPKWAMQI
jgi:hypothetical protein